MNLQDCKLSEDQEDTLRMYDKLSYSDIKKAIKFQPDTISKLIKKFLEVGDVILDSRCFNQRPDKLTLEEKTSLKKSYTITIESPSETCKINDKITLRFIIYFNNLVI